MSRELHPTEQAVLDLVTRQPGIHAEEISVIVKKTPGRISQIVAKLKAEDKIEQVPDKEGRGLKLRPSSTWMRKKIIRAPWSQFRKGK
jgi:hypothetical protein